MGVLLSPFPSPPASRHAGGSGELHNLWHAQSFAYAHLPLNDALPGSRSFRVGRLPLVRQRKQQYYCCLIYNLPVFRMTGASARWSRLHIPVETGTPPYRRSKLHIPRFALWKSSFIPLPLLFQNKHDTFILNQEVVALAILG